LALAAAQLEAPAVDAVITVGPRHAEQLAVAPPSTPVQVQIQGSEPLTWEGVPAAHNPLVGALDSATPYDNPQTPSTALAGAEQVAVVPPPLPAQLDIPPDG
jgi:hypothetical protein